MTTTGAAALVDTCRLASERHATLALVNVPPVIEQVLGRLGHEGNVTKHGVRRSAPGLTQERLTGTPAPPKGRAA